MYFRTQELCVCVFLFLMTDVQAASSAFLFLSYCHYCRYTVLVLKINQIVKLSAKYVLSGNLMFQKYESIKSGHVNLKVCLYGMVL